MDKDLRDIFEDIGPPDYSSRFNTELTPEQERKFQNWLVKKSIRAQRDFSKDMQDYDLRGFWLDSGGEIEDGHLPDTFKKPNHPTFSKESRWHGYAGYSAGEWVGNTFVPGPSNLQHYRPDQLKRYFMEVEPDADLAL